MAVSSDVEVTERGSGSSELLRATLNPLRFHREHKKFRASAPRQQTMILQDHGRTLCVLADRWQTAAIWAVAALSGLIVATRMYETHRPTT